MSTISTVMRDGLVPSCRPCPAPWGPNTDRTAVPADLGAVKAVSVGREATCAIRKADSKLVCFGDRVSNYKVRDPPADIGPVKAVSITGYTGPSIPPQSARCIVAAGMPSPRSVSGFCVESGTRRCTLTRIAPFRGIRHSTR